MGNFILRFRTPSFLPACPVNGHTDTTGFHYCCPTDVPGTANTFQNVALNNSSNDTLKCSQKRGLRLSSGDPFVSRRRVLVYRCRGMQPSWHRQPKLESSLAAGTVAPGTAGIFFEDDWALGTGRLYSPFVQADLVIKIK